MAHRGTSATELTFIAPREERRFIRVLEGMKIFSETDAVVGFHPAGISEMAHPVFRGGHSQWLGDTPIARGFVVHQANA